MSITGLVIHATPDHTAAVQSSIEACKGVEVHKVTDDGRMVVTIDNPDDGAAADTFESFKDIKGVLSTSLVYTHFEDHGEGEHVS
ncbi:MAG: chaperone NapD [Magnetovibrio sp.]|nr:chaperone NapD [Magnetovibrio sp.]